MDIIYASLITIFVVVIMSIKSPKIQAFLYAFPIPITVNLFATDGRVDGTHIFGLVNVLLFFYFIYLMFNKLNLNSVLSIFIATTVYIVVGFMVVDVSQLNFLFVAMLFIVGLLTHSYFFNKDTKVKIRSSSEINVWYRILIIFFLSLLILKLKGHLLGFAVTFPFVGVFVAYIMRDNLPILIGRSVKNFIAIALMFIAIYLSSTHYSTALSVTIGWIIFLPTLFILNRGIWME